MRPSETLENHLRSLVTALAELSNGSGLDGISEVVPRAARKLVGSDGATFVLRDGDQCHYVSEDAVSPLWAGERFPMTTCISGWVMLNREPAVIENIYADARIPHEAYRPTFVTSLVMTPIRSSAPIGAIGAYWAEEHLPTAAERSLLVALAEATGVAVGDGTPLATG